MIITRDDIINILKKWQNKEIDEIFVKNWASKILENKQVEITDWDKDDNSVTNEVLNYLEMLDVNLIISDDITYILDFLNSAKDDFEKSVTIMNNYFNNIEYDDRKKLLLKNDFYSKFCK